MTDEEGVGVYLYCVVDSDSEPAVTGIGGVRVRSISLDDVRVWAASLGAAPQPEVERMREHNAVVTSALDTGSTPVPLRFGQWFVTESQALDALRPRLDSLRTALDHVRGAVEYGVRVIDPAGGAHTATEPPHEERPASGRAYIERAAARLAARDRTRRTADEVADVLDELIGDVVRERKVEPLRSRSGVATLAHLVPREVEATYTERVRTIRARLPDYRFLFTGPWPPYSFAP